MALSPLIIERTVRAALEEDLGHGHDVTSELLIPDTARATAQFVSREDGVLSGLMVALTAFSLMSADFDMSIEAQDGEHIKAGQTIATVIGPARAILTAERVALNFMTHMSGIATHTRRFVDAIDGTEATIVDTRKTLPGLRAFQKYAVTCGGGENHRFGLDDAIMIKDNHIAVAGGIAEALSRASLLAGHTKKIEIEVDTLDQLQQVLDTGGADIVLLDNMDTDTLRKAVSMVSDKLTTEASGGVNMNTVRAIAETGVDYISIGALTHSAPNFDIGLDIKIK